MRFSLARRRGEGASDSHRPAPAPSNARGFFALLKTKHQHKPTKTAQTPPPIVCQLLTFQRACRLPTLSYHISCQHTSHTLHTHTALSKVPSCELPGQNMVSFSCNVRNTSRVHSTTPAAIELESAMLTRCTTTGLRRRPNQEETRSPPQPMPWSALHLPRLHGRLPRCRLQNSHCTPLARPSNRLIFAREPAPRAFASTSPMRSHTNTQLCAICSRA